MINYENAFLSQLIIHRVGNKALGDGLFVTTESVALSEQALISVGESLLHPFQKEDLLYNFYHESDVHLNVMHTLSTRYFADPANEFVALSGKAATDLYEKMLNPKFHGGEFWVAHFNGVVVDDEETQALGFFLMDTRKHFVKLFSAEEKYALEVQQGTDPSGFLAGCLICNTSSEQGYLISAGGKSKSLDLRLWMDDFLGLKQNIDDFYRTQQAMRMCKDYIMERMPEEFDVVRPDQAELMTKSMEFFKENDAFAVQDFQKEVLKQPELADSFNHFVKAFSREQDLNMEEKFAVNERAVKKMSRHFKSVIKLDGNFHIYVHGRREWIQRGFDEEQKLNFYQLFFEKED